MSAPAALRRSHCVRYSEARPASSIRTELLAWVQSPVFVQFWLPVHTQRGLPWASQRTRNLLWPRARGEHRRSWRSTFPSSLPRASAFWSWPFFSTLPLARTTWARGPSSRRAAIELRVVELVERGIDVPVLGGGFREQLEEPRAERPREVIAEGVPRLADDGPQLRRLEVVRRHAETPRDPLRRHDAAVEVGLDLRGDLMVERDLGGPTARRRGIDLEVLLVGTDHRQDAVPQPVTGLGHVIGPLVLLDRPILGRPALAVGVDVVLEADPGADDLLDAVALSEERETATVRDEPRGFPCDENVVAVVVGAHLHDGPPSPPTINQNRRRDARNGPLRPHVRRV